MSCGKAETRMLLSCFPALEKLEDPHASSSAGGTIGHTAAWADPKPRDSGTFSPCPRVTVSCEGHLTFLHLPLRRVTSDAAETPDRHTDDIFKVEALEII